MQITIQIPDNIPKKIVLRQVDRLEKKLRKIPRPKGKYSELSETKEENIFSEKIRKLAEEGDISEARSLLAEIPAGLSPESDRWRTVLSIPKVRQEESATGGNVLKNTQWLQNHAAAYRGKWVALKNGKLMGSHENQVELYRNIKQSGNIAGSMFFRVEN
ncbi:MAG: hypothetical protein AB7S75_05255 [Desulfococcaceae bacterium]